MNLNHILCPKVLPQYNANSYPDPKEESKKLGDNRSRLIDEYKKLNSFRPYPRLSPHQSLIQSWNVKNDPKPVDISKLFVVNNKPMVFKVTPNPFGLKLIDAIMNHGGVVANSNFDHVIADPEISSDLEALSYIWVSKCLVAQRLLDTNAFTVDNIRKSSCSFTCYNCKTTDTKTLWRRDSKSCMLCENCHLYLVRNNKHRPIMLEQIRLKLLKNSSSTPQTARVTDVDQVFVKASLKKYDIESILAAESGSEDP